MLTLIHDSIQRWMQRDGLPHAQLALGACVAAWQGWRTCHCSGSPPGAQLATGGRLQPKGRRGPRAACVVTLPVHSSARCSLKLRIVSAANRTRCSRLHRALYEQHESAMARAVRVMSAVRAGLSCERASMLLVDRVNSELLLVCTDADAAGMRMPIDTGVAGVVVASGRRGVHY